MSTETKTKKRSKLTLWVNRIVLLNGEPVGKGRPNKYEKKTRTCLYIPISQSYGSHTLASLEREYNPGSNPEQRKQFKRTTKASLKPVVREEAPVVAVNEPEAPVEAVKTAEATAPAVVESAPAMIESEPVADPVEQQ